MTTGKIFFTCAFIVLTYCTLKAQPGSLDLTFNPGTGFDQSVNTMAIQPDGKSIIGGGFSHFNNVGISNIARLNTDGNLDTSFNPNTVFTYGIASLVIQPNDEKIIATSYDVPYIARLDSTGALDATFNYAGGYASALALQNDGKIIIGGGYSVQRLNINGSVDLLYNANLYGMFNDIYSLYIQTDGKVLVAGNPTTTPSIARLDTVGGIDSSFNASTLYGTVVWSMLIQPNGKIIAGGNIPNYNGIVRLNADGTVDTTFKTQGTGFNGIVYSLVLQPDGKIIVGGSFLTYNGSNYNYIARINSDGSIDNTFNPGTGFYVSGGGEVNALAIQSDGKILTGGYYASYDGTSRNNIARLNGDNNTGINSINPSGSITVYPNPSTGIFYFNGIKSGSAVEIYDLLGRNIYSSVANSDNYSINLAGKENGVYYYKVIDQNNLIQQGKIVVE